MTDLRLNRIQFLIGVAMVAGVAVVGSLLIKQPLDLAIEMLSAQLVLQLVLYLFVFLLSMLRLRDLGWPRAISLLMWAPFVLNPKLVAFFSVTITLNTITSFLVSVVNIAAIALVLALVLIKGNKD